MDEIVLSDSELLRRHLAGDEAAFGLLRARHLGLVLGTCRRVTGNATLAEDAAQGVFLLLNERSRSLLGQASLAGWLHGAARNVARNLVREEGRRRVRERRSHSPEPPEADWSEVAPVIDDALARLSADDRDAVLLRFVQDRSLAQVGEALGIAENAARMRVTRALDRLRGHLRKGGAFVSAAVLATMLTTEMADASPLPPAPPSILGREALRRAFPSGWQHWALTVVKWVAAGGLIYGVILIVALYAYTAGLRPRPEIDRTMRDAVGSWRGELEYADDRTGARRTLPASVEVTGNMISLQIESQYEGFESIDKTSFSYSSGGTFEILNVGSHLLDGTYRVRPVGGGLVFEGYSPVLRADVRLQMESSPNRLTLREEIRRPGDPDYRFRNRFSLRRR
ncbi:RNA polymerase sigma factor [bacterium]|nr:MAG: RNA polymerase sigma factor [bacterium]